MNRRKFLQTSVAAGIMIIFPVRGFINRLRGGTSEVAIWDIELSDTDRDALANGVSPLNV